MHTVQSDEIEMRESFLLSNRDAEKWAGGCGVVESYCEFTQKNTVRKNKNHPFGPKPSDYVWLEIEMRESFLLSNQDAEYFPARSA